LLFFLRFFEHCFFPRFAIGRVPEKSKNLSDQGVLRTDILYIHKNTKFCYKLPYTGIPPTHFCLTEAVRTTLRKSNSRRKLHSIRRWGQTRLHPSAPIEVTRNGGGGKYEAVSANVVPKCTFELCIIRKYFYYWL